MNILPFNRYWDKIVDRKKWEEFTTFRAYTPERHSFYQRELSSHFQILVKVDDIPGEARLKGITFRWAEGLSLEEIKRDTFKGYTRDDFKSDMKKMYGIDNPFLIRLLLVWTKCNDTTPSLEVYDVIKKIVQDDEVMVLG